MEQTRDVTEGVKILSEKLGEYLDEEVVTNMTEIATAVNATKGAKFELVFDPTLVRGMSYYTGTILRYQCLSLAQPVAVADDMTR